MKSIRLPKIRVTLVLLVLAIGSVVTSTYFGSFGQTRLHNLKQQVSLLQHERSRLETVVARLHGEVDALENTDAALERYAREELALAKKNERVYVLVNPRSGGS